MEEDAEATRPSPKRRGYRPVLMITRAAALVLGVALVAACSGDGDDGEAVPSTTTTTAAATTTAAPSTTAAPPTLTPAEADQLAADVDAAGPCDWLDTSHCLLPFPSDRYVNGEGRIEIPAEAMPVNDKGVPVDPTAWLANDGYSVGTPIMLSVPGIDLEASALAPQGDVAASMGDGSGSVLVDLETGERIPHWVELDAREGIPDDERTLIVRPAVVLAEGHRVAVGFRGLRTPDGQEVEAPVGFRVYRDAIDTDIDAVEDRRPSFDAALEGLEAAGVERADLVLAWSFPVISQPNLLRPTLAMRDRAYELLDGGAPAFEVTEVIETDLPPGVARRVRGTFDVPKFLSGDGSPGSRLVLDAEGEPLADGTMKARFACSVPSSAVVEGDGRLAAQPVVYGHGLLGSEREAERGDLGMAEDGLLPCATAWIGMSDEDIPFAVTALGDLSLFPAVPDRLRQGLVAFQLLGVLLRHPQGFVNHPAFRTADGQPVFAGEVVYEGHSQGGIMGVAATAISKEWTKARLGVPGINYSTLLQRSVDWDTYEPIFGGGYPDPQDQLVLLALMQMLWDRGEGNGYARHLVDPIEPGTPAHAVIVEVAFADHQVAQVTAEILARTAGIPVRQPALADGRHPDEAPWYGLEEVGPADTPPSALVYWDAGTLPPPSANVPPTRDPGWVAQCTGQEESVPCKDPHEYPRRQPLSHRQREVFFATGTVVDVCSGQPCVAEPIDR